MPRNEHAVEQKQQKRKINSYYDGSVANSGSMCFTCTAFSLSITSSSSRKGSWCALTAVCLCCCWLHCVAVDGRGSGRVCNVIYARGFWVCAVKKAATVGLTSYSMFWWQRRLRHCDGNTFGTKRVKQEALSMTGVWKFKFNKSGGSFDDDRGDFARSVTEITIRRLHFREPGTWSRFSSASLWNRCGQIYFSCLSKREASTNSDDDESM